MKIIILNAGIGKRLQPITKKIPKCLIKISNNDTILDLQLKSLIKYNLTEIIILTGPFEKKIKEYIRKNYPKLKVQYVHNPRYERTNYIYSLYLTKEMIDDKVILFHGDLIFSDLLLENMIKSKYSNCVLVNKEIPLPKKDFKALLINDRVEKIGVNIFGSNAAFLAPLYKLSKEFFLNWLIQIEIFIKNNQVNLYAEDALNEILNQVSLKPIYFNTLFCMEIDDFEDLNRARSIFKEI